MNSKDDLRRKRELLRQKIEEYNEVSKENEEAMFRAVNTRQDVTRSIAKLTREQLDTKLRLLTNSPVEMTEEEELEVEKCQAENAKAVECVKRRREETLKLRLAEIDRKLDVLRQIHDIGEK